MVIDAWTLYEEMLNKDRCTKCKRKITDNLKTKNGCVWCDVKYYKENSSG